MAWRVKSGPDCEVFFPQTHVPGEQGQSDFTDMRELEVVIAGEKFAHLLYHFVLTYSNWESVSICPSESFEAMSAGMQTAFWRLGGVPIEHRTDNLSAATHELAESSTQFLLPVLEELLLSFPFIIRGFHSDNGTEYINHHVAQLLHKLLIEEQTKSRSNRSNDNAQAESKNASIVRKHFGYSHIPQRFAPLVNNSCREHLNPYINFHRPCLFAQSITDKKHGNVNAILTP